MFSRHRATKGKKSAVATSRGRFSRRWFESLERREVLDASLQMIHNAPFDLIGAFDVYINGALFVDNLAYQNAAPYMTVPSDVNLQIDITDFNAPDDSAPFYSTTVNLAADSSNIAMAEGNPLIAPGPGSFGVAISTQGRQFATNPANVEFLPFHGGIDVPTFDIVARVDRRWSITWRFRPMGHSCRLRRRTTRST